MLLALQDGLVRVALPVIRADLGTGIAGMQAVSVASLVVVTVTLVAFGRLADLAGPSRVYAVGLAVFAAGSGSAALAPGVAWLVAARAVQGVGWAMCAGSAPPLLVTVFPADRRARALAANHMALATGLAAGPAVGGLVVEHLGWRWGFAAFAPASVFLAASTVLRVRVAARRHPRPRFDVGGSLLLGAALVGALVPLLAGGPLDAGDAALVLASAAALALFVRRELRVPDPLVDLQLFADRAFSAGLAAAFLNFVSMASNMFLLPFLLEDHLGLPAPRAGAVMMVVPLAILAVAPTAGVLADRVGPRLPATAGLLALTMGVAGMGSFHPAMPLPWIVAVLLVYGAGAALFQSPNISDVLGAAPSTRLGTAAGTLATVSRLGQVAGIAVAGATWRAGLERYGTTPAATSWAFRDAFLVLAAFGALAVLASWSRGARRRPSPGPLAHGGVAEG